MIAEEAAFLRGVNADADLLRAELRRMQCFLRDADARRRGSNSERVTNWVVDVRAAAYEAEDALEEADLLARHRALRRGCSGVLAWCAHIAALHRFGQKIRRVRARIQEISDGAVAYGIANLGEASISVFPQDLDVTPPPYEYDLRWAGGHDSWVVGFRKERNEIIKELIDTKTLQVFVVSIVGMGGSGKSTLAKKIYNFLHSQQHFQAFCWLAVSQKYRFLDLIKDVAKRIIDIKREKNSEERNKDGEGTSKDGEGKSKVGEGTGKDGKGTGKDGKQTDQLTIEALEKMDEEEIIELLRKELAHRRFLAVLDDVWRCNSYREINRIIDLFPDVSNGSRIMLTTRDLRVAKHINKRNSIHQMKLLDEGQSWELLEKKAFQQNQILSPSDRSQLTPIGKKLAVKCNGLPLALVVLGGYLSRNLDYDIWLRLVDNLDWEARKDDEPVWDILARSYNDLPNHHLKSCFLYLASFLEDHIIRVNKLSRLWIAEGFVPERHNRTMEDTAREYTNELAQRCMLQVVDRSKVDGSIKTVVLHDILRDWCTKEASREGFFNIWCNTTVPVVYSDSMPSYRIALHNFCGHSQIVVSMPKLRTLWLSGSLSNALDLCSLTFLRVLDLYGIKDLERLPSGIGKMMYLRYLGLQNNGDKPISIPSSVSNLLNLQTLDVRNSTLSSLPRYFWDVPTLRHIHLTDVYRWAAPEAGRLLSLQTLHFSGVCSLYDIEEIPLIKHKRAARGANKSTKKANDREWTFLIEALPEMKQLVFLHLESWYSASGKRKRAMFPKRLITALSGHNCLRVLELSGELHWSQPLSHLAMLPCNLKKLKLIGSRLREDPMPVLGKLLNLVVLTLEYGSYQGETMTCTADGFRRLQYLAFNEVYHVRHWNIEAGAFPSLIQLNLIFSFREMTVPPQGLLHVKSLQELHLHPGDSKYVSLQNIEKLRGIGCKVNIVRQPHRHLGHWAHYG